ncbi:MAG: four helix bundle protein [Clostridiales bacterium]|nr:four helix bundle protein [Candidatus Cacconaster stercorequi]
MKRDIDDHIILDKSFPFAVRIVNLYKHLTKRKREYVLSKQILRNEPSRTPTSTSQTVLSK